jgi:flagellar export protein FliJ
MKAFRNPLENVLEIRRLQQRQRETELAVAARQRDDEQSALDRIRDEHARAAAYLPGDGTAGAGQSLLLREKYLQHQDGLARRQQEAVAQAERKVEERQQILIDARREVRALEVHRGKLRERWDLEFRREEQRETDDIVNAQRRQRAAEEAPSQ